MKLLISVDSPAEARIALAGGADIIDIKNPYEGSLGAQPPRVIEAIVREVGRAKPVSAALGDAPDLPGTMALAARGAVQCGVDMVKLGIHGPRSGEAAFRLVREVVAAVREVSETALVVVAGYADAGRMHTLSPDKLPGLAKEAGADGLMLDTGVKDGSSLRRWISLEEATRFVLRSHERGMFCALAGSLTLDDLPWLLQTGTDVAGFRGAVCQGDRESRVVDSKVLLLRNRLTDLGGLTADQG